jgi:hypothetical protein
VFLQYFQGTDEGYAFCAASFKDCIVLCHCSNISLEREQNRGGYRGGERNRTFGGARVA